MTNRKFLIASILAGAAFRAVAVSSAGVLVPVTPVPGSISMGITGINDQNVITGSFQTSDHAYHGFVGTIDGNYATFDYPTGSTSGRGINNDGYVTGLANPSGNNIFADAFIRSPDGTLTNVSFHKNTADGYVQGIIAHEKFVGEEWSYDQDFNLHVDGYFGKNLKYTKQIVLPFDNDQTRPRGYNQKGVVVGYYDDTDTGDHPGFLLKKGVASSIHYTDPNADYVFLEAINNDGLVAGFWTDQTQVTYGAFVYDSSAEKFKIIDVPHASYLAASGINASGIVTITADNSAYLYCTSRRKCPNGAGAIEINDRWVSARNNIREAVCRNGCLAAVARPLIRRNDARIQDAFERDAATTAERGFLRVK